MGWGEVKPRRWVVRALRALSVLAGIAVVALLPLYGDIRPQDAVSHPEWARMMLRGLDLLQDTPGINDTAKQAFATLSGRESRAWSAPQYVRAERVERSGGAGGASAPPVGSAKRSTHSAWRRAAITGCGCTCRRRRRPKPSSPRRDRTSCCTRSASRRRPASAGSTPGRCTSTREPTRPRCCCPPAASSSSSSSPRPARTRSSRGAAGRRPASRRPRTSP